jgi:DNA-binding response OmpR family regulator
VGPLSARILVIEDDPVLTGLLKLYLHKDGYDVAVMRDGEAGLVRALAEPMDLVILDIMLPKLDGWEVCRAIRAYSQVPILLLTGLDQEQHKIRGLDLGADDYVTKPFSSGELMARVRAALRRSTTAPSPERPSSSLSFSGLTIEIPGRAVVLDGRAIDLTPKEFDLLLLLAREPGRVFTHDDLLERVWVYPRGSDQRTLHTHVLRLRRKLQNEQRSFIQTVWGVGFKFETGQP